jgi:NAD(P)-dependent dehydrogenase (short-subunit alcohol dehydrogenase family)
LDGVAHCAGAYQLLPLQYLSAAKIETPMRTNVTGAIMLVKAFRARGCAVRGSGVVLVSSVAAFSGAPGLSAYAAGKAALTGFSRTAASELAAGGLRVNRTAMPGQAGQYLGAEQLEKLRLWHPLGFGEPRDVARAIAFLLAETGRWITGFALVLDGGYTLR